MSGIQKKSLWRPNSQLPWKAIKKGTDRTYLWYEIVDKDGWEVCVFAASAKRDEQEETYRQVVFLLTQVNGTSQVEIDDNELEIEWRT